MIKLAAACGSALSFLLLSVAAGVGEQENAVTDQGKLLSYRWDYGPAQRQALLRQAGVLLMEDSRQPGSGSTDFYFSGLPLLPRIVSELAELGDLEGARKLALDIPAGWTFPSGFQQFLGVTLREVALDSVAKAMLKAGRLEDAAALAEEIEYRVPQNAEPGLDNDYPDRQGILMAVIERQAQIGQYERAFATAHTCWEFLPKNGDGFLSPSAEYLRAMLNRPVFVAMAAHGLGREAAAKARATIRDDHGLAKTLRSIVLAAAQAGYSEDAETVAAGFFQKPSLVAILSEISTIESLNGRRANALATRILADRMLETVKDPERKWVLRQVAVDQAKAGNHYSALVAAAQGVQGFDYRIEITFPSGPGYLLPRDCWEPCYQTMAYAEMEDGRLSEARKSVLWSKAEGIRLETLLKIAEKQQETGDLVGACETLEDAWKDALSLSKKPINWRKS